MKLSNHGKKGLAILALLFFHTYTLFTLLHIGLVIAFYDVRPVVTSVADTISAAAHFIYACSLALFFGYKVWNWQSDEVREGHKYE